MSESIIVTGGNGFVGSHLVKELIKKKYKPILIIRDNSDLYRFKDIGNLITIVANDYEDKKLIKKLKLFSPKYFFHCAWEGVSGSKRNDKIQIKNIKLCLESIELTKKVGCFNWTGLGSHAEYGNLNTILTEKSECKPTTLYGKSKLESCIKSLKLCNENKITGNWIRIFNTYGPYDNQTWLIPYIIRSLKRNESPDLTNCEQVWDYLHINDAVKAIIKVSELAKGGIFNLGSENPRKLKEFISIITNEIGNKIINFGSVPYRKDQVMYLHPDISKIKKFTNWKPKINFEYGIKELVKTGL